MKRNWIFQGNPDVFDIDTYVSENTDIVWSVRQKHLAGNISIGDNVFLWRSAGSARGVAGVIAQGTITDTPKEMPDDAAADSHWTESPEIELRVKVKVTKRNLGKKQVVNRDWLKEDPVLSNMTILKQPSATNFFIQPGEARRLSLLVKNTGVPWTSEESIAGLWAYAHTYGESVSKGIGSPVSMAAVAIGRAVTGVYNKVMNFRALDPRDERSGLSGGSQVDEETWSQFYDSDTGDLDIPELDKWYFKIWGTSEVVATKPSYQDFGDAPNDNINELQTFAARVRRGQPQFRENLLTAYGSKCAITGTGPEQVLEAVHIVPHAVSGINELDNGLLLRADLHALFDADLLKINPETFEIIVDESIRETHYYTLNGRKLRARVDGSQVSPRYIQIRYH